MAEDISHSKIKKRKALRSDSDDDEVLKKHKPVDSDEPTERELDSSEQVSEKYAASYKQPREGKKNGKYEKTVENGLTDSDSAGTDVEPTTDDESPQPDRRPKKKRKISMKNERRSRNNVQVGSSSESEDEGPLSPKSPPSSKKSFRRRRTISGGKAPSKKSSDSESYKTDSESDEESQAQEQNKGSATTQMKTKDKEGESKSQTAKVESCAKNKVAEGSSDSEDDVPLQKPKQRSSSEGSERVTKGNGEQASSKKKKSEAIAKSEEVIDRDSGSSSDQCSEPTGPPKTEERDRSMKRDSSSDEGKVKPEPETTDESEDENSKNPAAVKRESTSGDSDSEPLSRGKADREPEQKKMIKREKSSSDSGSDSSHTEKTAKSAEARRKSENKKRKSDSDSSSSKEDTKKEKRRKNKAPDEDKRIISLKKYLKTAGIRVHNYADLWKDCRSNKARAQKLLSLLEENGLKGRPTIEKCKKLRKKIETRREVEELDLANVMECGEGRTRRSRQRSSSSQERPNETVQVTSEIRKRLKVLAESESSESE